MGTADDQLTERHKANEGYAGILAQSSCVGCEAPILTKGGLTPRAIRRVRDYIDQNLGRSLSLDELATAARLSVFHFARCFKRSQGLTPHAYVIQRRIERAQELLLVTELPVSEIALVVGFSDQSHLARRFRQRVGSPPQAYRARLQN